MRARRTDIQLHDKTGFYVENPKDSYEKTTVKDNFQNFTTFC